MVVVLEGGKLVGRAIVWKIDSNDNNLNFEWVMDRQYSTRDSVVEKMKRYAEEQGWAYRTNNNHYSISKFTYEGKEYSMNIEIRIKSKDYGKYPYMDTFGLYDKSSGILTNNRLDSLIYSSKAYFPKFTLIPSLIAQFFALSPLVYFWYLPGNIQITYRKRAYLRPKR